MRNIVFLFVLSLIFFFSSCSSKEQKAGPGINKTVETTVSCTENVPSTSPRWGCDGRKLEGQKITGWTTESTETTKTVPCNFSDEELAKMGYTYTGTGTRVSRPARPGEEDVTESIFTSETLPWPIKWLGWLVFIAIMLSVLLFLLWLLRELANRLINLRIPNQTSNHSQVTSTTGNPVPPVMTCQANQCACNQQALSVLQSMIDGKYSFTAPCNALIPEKGVYVGIKGEDDDLHINSYGYGPEGVDETPPSAN